MNRRFFGLVLVVLLFSLTLGATLTQAQTTTTGDVAGTVTDPSGAVIPDAKVNLRDVSRGATQEGATTKDGVYHFSLLLPGRYIITANAKGFQTVAQQVDVAVGKVSSVDIQLPLGSTTQTVIVSEATAPLIQVENGNVASTITEKQAENIPNPGNDLTYMAQIAPGSTMNTAGGGLGNFSSYGISAVANLFTINGMDDNDPFLNLNNSGATNLTLGQNEIQEVSVVTNGYSGQYAGLAGANVNYITRSGTNEFHGRATWFWNGRTMNANSWFNNATGTPRSFVNANQYGGDIGGPIFKDKLFFYFNAEGLYLVIPTSTQAIIPSPGFAAATLANIDSIFGPGSASSLFYHTMIDPITGLYASAPGASRATNSLPNGGCDASAFPATYTSPPAPFVPGPPSALALLGFGATNPCALAFQSNVSNKTHEHLEAGRIDWNATKNDRFFGRVQHDRGLQASITDPINPLFNIQSDQPEWQGQFQETHTFSSTKVNQLIVSAQWYQAIFGQASPTATFNLYPTTLIMASGQFSNLGGFDFDFPQGRIVTQGQISDDFSWAHGVHTFKFGFKWRRNWTSDHDFGVGSTGLLIPLTQDAFFEGGVDPLAFTNPGSPNGGDFTLDSGHAFPKFLSARMQNFVIGGYAEDDWRAKPNLTFTLSFRLDHQSNPVCVQRCFVQTPVPFPQLSTDPTTPYNTLVKINQSQMLPGLTAIEPQPRIGFAWQPREVRWMHELVIRGGVGVFYDIFPAVQFDNFAENPPNDPTFTTFFDNLTPGETCGGTCSNLFLDASSANQTFQNGFSTGGSFSSLGGLTGAFSAPALASSVAHPEVPRYIKWNLEVERQFGMDTVFGIQYVGNRGTRIFFLNGGINTCQPGAPFSTLPACAAPLGVSINPNPSFNTVGFGTSIGESNYNGVTLSFTHRYKSGLVQVNYTYSHAFDTDSNSGVTGTPFSTTFFGATNSSIQLPEDPFNPKKFNYASADQDIRHNLNANYVWELPIKQYITRGHGPDRLLKGWDVNGSVFLRSGFPFTLVDNATSSALSSTGYGPGSTVFGTVLAPGGVNFSCTAAAASLAGGGTPKVEPNQGICLAPILGLPSDNFTTSPSGFGNVIRNSIRGPHYFNSDFSLMKHTPITERVEFVLGAQFYNVFNHPNFDAPIMDTSNPQFGLVTRTVASPTTIFGSVLGADASPRLVQLKLQLKF